MKRAAHAVRKGLHNMGTPVRVAAHLSMTSSLVCSHRGAQSCGLKPDPWVRAVPLEFWSPSGVEVPLPHVAGLPDVSSEGPGIARPPIPLQSVCSSPGTSADPDLRMAQPQAAAVSLRTDYRDVRVYRPCI
jgi:hypothetical protein